MGKNGSSHLDFVLSFTIFILFVVFMYSIIQPAIETPQGKESLLKLLRFDLLDLAQANDMKITTIYYKGDPSNPVKDCIKDEIGGTVLDGVITDENEDNLKIKDENGNIVNYDFQGGSKLFQLDLDPLNIRDTRGDSIFKIYYSPETSSTVLGGLTGCKEITTNDVVELGAIKTEKQKIISSKIFGLLDFYNTDCGASIKTSLGFPSDSEFTFRFLLANGSRIESKEECAKISNQTSVYAEEFPVQYLNESLSLHVGKMSVKVW